MAGHSEEKPYVCDICNKQLAHVRTLKTHMLNPFDEKPYSCEICKKQFLVKNTLKIIHTEERPYPWEKCYKPFKHLRNLTNLLPSHDTEGKSKL